MDAEPPSSATVQRQLRELSLESPAAAGHTEAHALLITWEKSDLNGSHREVDRLGKVFSGTYRYTSVVQYKIPTSDSTTKTRKFLRDWLHQRAKIGVALVVYFGGHGLMEKGELVMSNVSQPIKLKRNLHMFH